jgi:hypothetical protein
MIKQGQAKVCIGIHLKASGGLKFNQNIIQKINKFKAEYE